MEKKRVVISVIAAVIALNGLGYAEEETAVSHVMNADKFNTASGKTVKLLCVKAPETARYQKKSVNPVAKEGIAYTRKEFEDKKIRLVYESVSEDAFGTQLAYAFRKEDNLFLNAELLKAGYAQVDTAFPCPKFLDQFLTFEKEAQTRQLGMWKPSRSNEHDQNKKKP